MTMIGAGGIGAIATIVLGKMGFGKLEVYDKDVVEEENVATQFYTSFDIGTKKVSALYDIFSLMAEDVEFISHAEEVTAATDLPRSDIVISGVDSINARKEIWEAVKRTSCIRYIETRMTAETFQMYVVDPENGEWYDNFIKSVNEEDVPDLPCTAKATFYTGALAASMIGMACRRIVTREHLDKIYAVSLPNNSFLVIE